MLSKEPALLKVSVLHLQKIKMIIKYLNSLLNISTETNVTTFIVSYAVGFFENVVGVKCFSHSSQLFVSPNVELGN